MTETEFLYADLELHLHEILHKHLFAGYNCVDDWLRELFARMFGFEETSVFGHLHLPLYGPFNGSLERMKQ